MPAPEWLCHSIGIDSRKLTIAENQLLEGVLFSFLCDELLSDLKTVYKDYFRIIHCNHEKEEEMLESYVIRCLIQDLLSSHEYSLPGIAFYTDTPQEVISDIASGIITNPSMHLARKIIELHRSVRPELYQKIFEKISQLSKAA